MEMIKLNIQLFASATSEDKKLTSDSGNYGYLKASFSESNPQAFTNKSTISATATLTRKTGSWSAIGKTSLQIWWYDDNEYSGGKLINSIAVPELAYGNTGNTATISGTLDVTHHADGTLSGYAKAVWEYTGSFQHTYDTGSISTANTVLDKIPRYLAITSFGCSSASETQLNFSWVTDNTCDRVEYKINGASSWTPAQTGISATSGSFSISGTANTTYKVQARCRRKDSQLWTSTSEGSYTTYNYPYLSENLGELTIGGSHTLKLYNPLSREVDITATIPNPSGGTKTLSFGRFNRNSITVTPNIDELYKSIPASKTGTITYYCDPVASGSTTSKSATFKCNDADCKPVIPANAIQYKELSETVKNLIGDTNNQILVQSHSQLGIKFSAASPQNYAQDIQSYKITCAGTSITEKTETQVPSTYLDFGKVNNTSITITLIAKDRRGYESDKYTLTINDNIRAWSKPTVTLSAKRQNDFNEETDIIATITNWSNIEINGVNYNSKQEKAILTLMSNEGTSLSNTPTIYVFDKEEDYDTSTYKTASKVDILDGDKVYFYQVQIEDAFGASSYNYATAIVNRGVPIAMVDGEKLGVGINCFPDGKGLYLNGYRVPVITYGTGNPSGGETGDVYIKIS